jgi:hypothetical protein
MAEQTRDTTAQIERRRASRRRTERRDETDASFEGVQQRATSRRKVERRRQIDPTTCERDYSDAEIAFMTAMDEYKRKSGRMFPTWSEVLEVVECLGYRRVADPTEILPRGK